MGHHNKAITMVLLSRDIIKVHRYGGFHLALQHFIIRAFPNDFQLFSVKEAKQVTVLPDAIRLTTATVSAAQGEEKWR